MVSTGDFGKQDPMEFDGVPEALRWVDFPEKAHAAIGVEEEVAT